MPPDAFLDSYSAQDFMTPFTMTLVPATQQVETPPPHHGIGAGSLQPHPLAQPSAAVADGSRMPMYCAAYGQTSPSSGRPPQASVAYAASYCGQEVPQPYGPFGGARGAENVDAAAIPTTSYKA